MTEKFKYKYALESWISIHWVPEVFSRVGQGASSHEKPLSPRVQRAKNERFIINSTDSSTPQWGNHLLIKYRKKL